MKLIPTLLAGTIVAAGLTWQGVFDNPDIACTPDLDGGIGGVMSNVSYRTGQTILGLSAEPPSTERTADVVVGTMQVLGTWTAALTAGMRGEPKPPSVTQFEARAVTVQQASLTACAPCPGLDSGVQPASLTAPTTSITGYSGEQLVNARAIMDAGSALGIGVHGQTVAVMTAMGESSLRVLDRGDAAGPDSRGLFQQRDNGAWGTYEQRMNPTASATSFYRALLQVPGWESLTPTEAAHRTQGNADPNHYVSYWQDATAVVNGLGGTGVTQAAACAPAASGVQPASTAIPAGGKTVADLVAFGHALEARGVRVSENAAMGDPPRPGSHSSTGWHYKHGGSGAIDVNTRSGTSVQEQRELAVIAQEAMALGFGVIFMREEGDHDGHLHVDIGEHRDVGDLTALLAGSPAGSA